MDDFISVMMAILEFFKIPIVIYGFTFSLWNVFMFGAFATLIIKFVVKVIRDDD